MFSVICSPSADRNSDHAAGNRMHTLEQNSSSVSVLTPTGRCFGALGLQTPGTSRKSLCHKSCGTPGSGDAGTEVGDEVAMCSKETVV